MLLIGLDAGTTSVSGVLLDAETRTAIEVISREHHAALEGTTLEEDIQNPDCIVTHARSILDDLIVIGAAHYGGGRSDGNPGISKIAGIGITGQVHGILYTDAGGKAVSPLYTWQDRRGMCNVPKDNNLAYEDHAVDWTTRVKEITGHTIPSGYGVLTHIINQYENKIPADAVAICTILDYLSMQLTGTAEPSIESTNAHSLGLFDLQEHRFITEMITELGVEQAFLPRLVDAGAEVGIHTSGIPVFIPVGDNQAGFIGAVRKSESSVLVNIGTSGQMSVYTASETLSPDELREGRINGLEIRPFPGGGYIITGASLAGGSAHRLLEQFFREVCRTFGGIDPGSLFMKMNSIGDTGLDASLLLDISTQFYGTREDQSAAGKIAGITKDNLSSRYLINGFLRGITGELHRFYSCLPAPVKQRTTSVVGVGNAIRKNTLMQRCIEEVFQLPLEIPETSEEAAFGAALIAGVGAGIYRNYLTN